MSERIQQAQQWFLTAEGSVLQAQEQHCIDSMLPMVFGYHLMQLSVCPDTPLYNSSKIRHRFSLAETAGSSIAALCAAEDLPIANESIDVALLHHVLEFSEQPHRILQELARVIMPSGYVVLVGFNPLSLLGLASFVGRWFNRGVGYQHALRRSRLEDWLTLMGFTVQRIEQGYYLPPWPWLLRTRLGKACNRWLGHRQWPLGGFYIVLAKKEVVRLTPLRPKLPHRGAGMIPLMEPLYTTKPSKKSER